MRTLLLVLFSIAWAAVAFAVIRALVIAWGYHRRLATVTAFAVAAAFALGSLSPLSLARRGTPSGPPVVAAAVPVAIACPQAAKLTSVAGAGHLDSVTIGGASADVTKPIEARADDTVHVGGWSLSSAGLATGLCVLVDGRRVTFDGTYGVDRPDVATALGKPEDRGAGFDVALRLPKGTHVISVGPVQADGTVTPIAQQITAHVR